MHFAMEVGLENRIPPERELHKQIRRDGKKKKERKNRLRSNPNECQELRLAS